MAADLRHAHEKFLMAVRSLVIGRGPIRERLVTACLDLSSIHIDAPDGKIEQAIADLLQRVTRVRPPSSGEIGSIQATIRQMSEDEAVEIAEDIRMLEYQLRDR